MRSFVGYCCALVLLAGLAGCAGTDFVRPSIDTLKNGHTTYAQILEKMGPPRREGTMTKNEKQLKVITYAYATTGGKAVRESVVPARAQAFYFYNDTLVGHEFGSSFAVDHSDFDDKKVSDIVKGKTTRAEVIQLVGKPGGYYVYPLIKSTSGDAVVYVYTETTSDAPFSVKQFRKVLIVSFDTAGLVSEVDFSSSGNK